MSLAVLMALCVLLYIISGLTCMDKDFASDV